MKNLFFYTNEGFQAADGRKCSDTCQAIDAIKKESEDLFLSTSAKTIKKTINCKIMDCTCETRLIDISFAKLRKTGAV
jgi:hypothetical protein